MKEFFAIFNESFTMILYITVCVILILWIAYDILNLIIKRKTYDTVEAEVCEHELIPKKSVDDSITYQTKLRYVYNNKVNYYTTKWAANFFIPKIGAKRKIYINKNDSSKIYYVETKMFIFFILFRITFFIPLFYQK